MLLTKEYLKKIPKLGETKSVKIENKWLWVKLFTPWSNWTWYIVEMDQVTGECFGFIAFPMPIWGYFNIKELMEIRGSGGMKIKRDRHFVAITFGDWRVKVCE